VCVRCDDDVERSLSVVLRRDPTSSLPSFAASPPVLTALSGRLSRSRSPVPAAAAGHAARAEVAASARSRLPRAAVRRRSTTASRPGLLPRLHGHCPVSDPRPIPAVRPSRVPPDRLFTRSSSVPSSSVYLSLPAAVAEPCLPGSVRHPVTAATTPVRLQWTGAAGCGHGPTCRLVSSAWRRVGEHSSRHDGSGSG